MKKKGFIFSVDSIGAIGIAVMLGIAWVFFVHYETGNKTNAMNKKVQDTALVKLYTGESSSDSLDTSREIAVCKKYFTYNQAGNSVNIHTYCEAIG